MDYSYVFSDFTDEMEPVQVIYHRERVPYQITARVNDNALLYRTASHIPAIVADLIDIATSVYIADWLSPRKKRVPHQIGVTVPLRHPEIFGQSNVVNYLQNLLHWYTKDCWYFEFRPRVKTKRLAERQSRLQLTNRSVEVALWSGGLDSLAGLYNRLLEQTASQYTLFGTGSNLSTQGKQREIAEKVRNKFGHYLRLIQLPIQIRYLPSRKPATNDSFRARGFVFKLLGAMCAYLEGQDTLHIYENGFGAINLPYRLSEVGLAHTRSVHPISLLKTGEFVSKILGTSFTYHNPFLYSTKAQMCEVLSRAEATDLAFATITCAGRHRQADQPSQCGYCSSCLLRRLALAASQIEDKTRYALLNGNIQNQSSHDQPFGAMQSQVKILQSFLTSEDPWRDLIERYPELRRIASCLAKQEKSDIQVIQSKLLQLYKCHVEEWNHAQGIIGQEFLN